jgi:hypothetical protein
MNTRILALTAIAAFAISSFAQADTLLVDRVKHERHWDAPGRGMSMSQVEQHFGAPKDKLSPAGGDSKVHPVINRWVYDNYVVYFERDRVITIVASRATTNEIGPRPANQ